MPDSNCDDKVVPEKFFSFPPTFSKIDTKGSYSPQQNLNVFEQYADRGMYLKVRYGI